MYSTVNMIKPYSHTYISMYIQKAHPGCQNYYVRSVNVGLVRHFAVRFMTRKSRIEMKDDHRNGNNQKFGKHSACHKIHHDLLRAVTLHR